MGINIENTKKPRTLEFVIIVYFIINLSASLL